MGVPVQAHSASGRIKCARVNTRPATGSKSSTSLASIQRFGAATALVGLMLPAAFGSPAAWGRVGGTGRHSSRLAFGYALPSRSYSPPSFYPPGTPAPAEELHFEQAVEAARQSRARRIERFPAFPETPTAVAHEITGSITAMARAHALAAAERKAAEDEEDSLSFPTSTPRLRVDLQLDDLSGLSDDWARAVQHRYLPFYEKMLLSLRAQGYKKVLAVFGFRQEAQFVEKRLRQAGALAGGIRVDHLAGRESTKFLDIGKPDLVLFFNPQTINGDLSELSEFQRAVAVSTIRGAPVVLVNPALSAFTILPRGLDVVRPMILSDFEPCFQVSAHRYRYNPALSYSIIRRGEAALPATAAAASEEGAAVLGADEAAGRVAREGPWEVFAHDSRLPGSGWAYLESRVDEPFRLEVESKYFDSCFFIKKPASAPAENPFREADYADYSDKGLAH